MISTISWQAFGDFVSSPAFLTVAGFILAILGTVIKLFGSKLTQWLQGKLIEPLTKLVTKLAPTVIAAVDQELVDSLRKAGEWAENKYHEAMELAYTKMQAMLTVKQWNLLEKLIGKDEVREFVKSIINQVLRENKPTTPIPIDLGETPKEEIL